MSLVEEKKIRSRGIHGIPFLKPGKILSRGNWRIYRPVIKLEKCIKCRLCWVYCPDGAICLDKNDFPHIDKKVCKGCLTCEEVCPVKAISKVREK